MAKKGRKVKVVSKLIIGIIIGIACLLGGIGYKMLWAPNFIPSNTIYIYVDSVRDFDDLCAQVEKEGRCKDLFMFRLLAGIFDYPSEMLTGRYAINPGMNNLSLLNDLRRGHQKATSITFNSVRLKEDLAESLDKQLMLSTEDLLSLLNDSAYCSSLGFTTQTIAAIFIPNTYEVYWNISPARLVERMLKEYNRFWTEERKAKAASQGLTPVEVEILASIVQEETADLSEYPVIAGLYLNRLRRGMLLQADPTVKFAVGDFSLQRVLYKHLEIDSPYNTYKYAGLPPGLLRLATIQGIDAVLNATKHSYLYMCAKEDFSGKHNFARTLAEHSRNALRYQQALNRRNIR